MFRDFNSNLFLYVAVTAAVIMAAVWHFLLAPMERKNHERKLEILQRRIKQHEAELKAGIDDSEAPGADDGARN